MSKIIISEQHTFALYGDKTEILDSGNIVRIVDESIHHRICHVLRLTIGDTCIIFNTKQHGLVRIVTIKDSYLEVMVLSKESNRAIQPEITLLLPLLKKDAFEEVLYSATELAVTSIQLVLTVKSQRKLVDVQRMQRIMIAAAEQSKNFVLPEIQPVRTLQDILKNHMPLPAFCLSMQGQPACSLIGNLKQSTVQNIVLLVGPEGDFTQEEYQQIEQAGFLHMKLTPTVLRSSQATVIGLGILRSLVFCYSSLDV